MIIRDDLSTKTRVLEMVLCHVVVPKVCSAILKVM